MGGGARNKPVGSGRPPSLPPPPIHYPDSDQDARDRDAFWRDAVNDPVVSPKDMSHDTFWRLARQDPVAPRGTVTGAFGAIGAPVPVGPPTLAQNLQPIVDATRVRSESAPPTLTSPDPKPDPIPTGSPPPVGPPVLAHALPKPQPPNAPKSWASIGASLRGATFTSPGKAEAPPPAPVRTPAQMAATPYLDREAFFDAMKAWAYAEPNLSANVRRILSKGFRQAVQGGAKSELTGTYDVNTANAAVDQWERFRGLTFTIEDRKLKNFHGYYASNKQAKMLIQFSKKHSERGAPIQANLNATWDNGPALVHINCKLPKDT